MIMMKIKNHHILIIAMWIICMGGQWCKSSPQLILNESKILTQFNKVFKKNYNEKSEAGYILDVHVKYLEKIYEFHWDLTFLPQRKKKIEKLVTNLCDKSEYVLHIRNLKQALKHGLLFKKVHRGISFNQ